MTALTPQHPSRFLLALSLPSACAQKRLTARTTMLSGMYAHSLSTTRHPPLSSLPSSQRGGVRSDR
jgi:hypothetical protein